MQPMTKKQVDAGTTQHMVLFLTASDQEGFSLAPVSGHVHNSVLWCSNEHRCFLLKEQKQRILFESGDVTQFIFATNLPNWIV